MRCFSLALKKYQMINAASISMITVAELPIINGKICLLLLPESTEDVSFVLEYIGVSVTDLVTFSGEDNVFCSTIFRLQDSLFANYIILPC